MLLESSGRQARPRIGKILLLKVSGQPALGVRVIKHYPEENRFAVRQVRRYGTYDSLPVGQNVVALEKIGEIPLYQPSPAVSARDQADLLELERMPVPTAPISPMPSETAPASSSDFDVQNGAMQADPFASDSPPPPPPPPPGEFEEPPTLDSVDAQELESLENAPDNLDDPPPPPPPDEDEGNESEFQSTSDEVADEDTVEVYVQEKVLFDPHLHAVSVGYGMVANGESYWSSAGVRYALTVDRSVFITSKTIQDTLALEGGLYFYRLDQNSVITSVGTARYNIWPGPNFSPFVYAGLLFNYATPDLGSTDELADAATGLVPAAGFGFMYQFAPQWEARVDIGIDMIGAALMLRF